MASNDQEILEEFTRVTFEADRICLEVCDVTWNGPAEPVSTWMTVKVLPPNLDRSVLLRLRKELLKRQRFFKTFDLCGQRNPSGWMDSSHSCQSCAERCLGVVH